MKLTATQLRKIIREEVKRTRRLHEATELDADLIRQEMVEILNAYEGLDEHLSGELYEDVASEEAKAALFNDLILNITKAQSLLEDLLNNAEELRGLEGTSTAPSGHY